MERCKGKDSQISMVEQIKMPEEKKLNIKKDSLPEVGVQQIDNIALWQQTATSDMGSDENDGIAAQLVRVCDDTLSYLSSQANTGSASKRHARALRRHRVQLKLWADGHGVRDGNLDKILAESKHLQHTTLTVLNSLCKTLFKGMFEVDLLGTQHIDIRLCRACQIQRS